MKRTLKISVLLNVVLLGGTVFLWMRPRTVTVPVPAAPATAVKVPAQELPEPMAQTVAAPFRWNQLMPANNYRGFVANLRAAGCPEPTIEDIVWGDTGRAFSWERSRLGIDENQSGPWSSQAQAQMVAYFLGQNRVPVAEGLANNQSPNNQPAGATTPMVLKNVDLSTLNLSDAQNQAIANVRDTFWNSVGGPNQDTNDPAYQARWQKAQRAADSMFRVAFGSDYWKYLMTASAQAASQN